MKITVKIILLTLLFLSGCTNHRYHGDLDILVTGQNVKTPWGRGESLTVRLNKVRDFSQCPSVKQCEVELALCKEEKYQMCLQSDPVDLSQFIISDPSHSHADLLPDIDDSILNFPGGINDSVGSAELIH